MHVAFDRMNGLDHSFWIVQIWVETLLPNSSYELSTFAGFYRCFNFISGKNSKNLKIEMTGPVHIKPAPESNGWKIAFFVPKRYAA